MSGEQHPADARRRAEEWLTRYDGAVPSIPPGSADPPEVRLLRALLAAGPEAKTPVTTPVPWLECLTVISNPIVPQGAILIHPDTLAGKPDALAYRPPDPLPPPVPITPTPCGGRCEDALDSRSPCPSCAERLAPPPAPEAPILPVCLDCSFASGGHVHLNREDGTQAVRAPTAEEWNAAIRQTPPSDAVAATGEMGPARGYLAVCARSVDNVRTGWPPSDAVREAAEDVVRGDWWGHYCPSCGSTFKHGPECRIGRLAKALSSARAAKGGE